MGTMSVMAAQLKSTLFSRDKQHRKNESPRYLWCSDRFLPAGHGVGKQSHWGNFSSQSLIVLSELPLASVLPSLLHATALTESPCTLNVRGYFPPATSQSLIVLSSPPLASVLPSSLHATDKTEPPCPLSLRFSA
jgi:hypothetical protein